MKEFTKKWTLSIVGVAIALGVTAPSVGEEPKPEPTAARAEHVVPLAAAEAADLAPLIAAAERFRGLTLRTNLAAGIQQADTLRDTFGRALAEEMPAGELRRTERALRMLGLWPRDRDLETSLLELMVGEVAGYYDSSKDVLTIVQGDDGAAIAGIEGLDPVAAERLEDAIWVHEVNHALQDQHFNLESLIGTEEGMLSDRSLARRALVEGDATLVMFGFVFGAEIERIPHAGSMFSGAGADPFALAAMAPNQSSEALLDAPAYLQNLLIFPYFAGMDF